MSLAEVAAAVSEHLKNNSIYVVVVDGCTITSQVTTDYTSINVYFALSSDSVRRLISTALKELGFEPRRRIFVHPDTAYTVDFVAEPPYIDQEPVYDFAEIQTSFGRFRVLKLE